MVAKDALKYGSAVVVYVALTLVTKMHLNWIVGPLFLVAIFDVVPGWLVECGRVPEPHRNHRQARVKARGNERS